MLLKITPKYFKLKRLVKEHGVLWKTHRFSSGVPALANRPGYYIESLDGSHQEWVEEQFITLIARIIEFTDENYLIKSVPYKRVKTIEADSNGFSIITCKNDRIIPTTTAYIQLKNWKQYNKEEGGNFGVGNIR